MNSTLIKITYYPLYNILTQPTIHCHHVGPHPTQCKWCPFISRTLRNNPFVPLWSHIIHTLLVANHLYPFGPKPFIPFRSRTVCTLSVPNHSHPFGTKPFSPFWYRPIRTLSIPNRSHPFGHNTFAPFRSRTIHTPWVTT